MGINLAKWSIFNITADIEKWLILNFREPVFLGSVHGPLMATFYKNYNNLAASNWSLVNLGNTIKKIENLEQVRSSSLSFFPHPLFPFPLFLYSLPIASPLPLFSFFGHLPSLHLASSSLCISPTYKMQHLYLMLTKIFWTLVQRLIF